MHDLRFRESKIHIIFYRGQTNLTGSRTQTVSNPSPLRTCGTGCCMCILARTFSLQHNHNDFFCVWRLHAMSLIQSCREYWILNITSYLYLSYSFLNAGTYFNCIMFMVASSVVTTIMILNYHHRKADTHSMPHWVGSHIPDWVGQVRICRVILHSTELVSAVANLYRGHKKVSLATMFADLNSFWGEVGANLN